MRRERGITTVEFAIVATVFLVLVFGVIEFGRALFTWNSLAEATRRAVRVAVVCPVNHSAIRQVALFVDPRSPGAGLRLPDLTADNIEVTYLDAVGGAIADPVAEYTRIRYVRVRIVNYIYRILIPLHELDITAPDFQAVLPRESLGVPREGAGPECFGTAA